MKTKILIAIPLLFVSINLICLVINNIFLIKFNENILIIINSLFMMFLIFIYYNERKKSFLDAYNDTSTNNHINHDSFQINAQLLINHFSDFLCIKDKDGRWLGASETYLKLFNLQDVNYVGKTDAELFHYSNSNVDILNVSDTQDKSAWHLKTPVKETRIVTLDEQIKTLEITRIPLFDDKKNKSKIILTGNFITLDDKKKDQLQLLSKVFELCHLSLIFLDKDLQITEVNKTISDFTGYSKNELIGKHLSFIMKGKMANLKTDFFSANKGRLWSGELQCLTKKGLYSLVRLDVSEIPKEDNSFIYFASLFDISQHSRDKKEIVHLSHYDKLTGLFNRISFYKKLSDFIENDAVTNYGIIFLIDLNRFKVINELLGHSAGDELLKIIARRLKESLSSDAVVARMSGDEFAILIIVNNGLSYEDVYFDAFKIAGRMSRTLSEVIHLDKNEAFIGSSIGIALYPEKSTDKSINSHYSSDNKQMKPMLIAELLLKNADLARKKAKSEGKNKYEFYKSDNNVSQEKNIIELNLRKAIVNNELKLYYQPQYNIQEKKICGAEVLIRWKPTNEDMIPPDKFIAIAEDSGLIIEIGYWILHTACLQLKKWLDAGYPLTQISVNVSAPQFNDPNFLSLVDKALLESKLTTTIDLIDKVSNTLQNKNELHKTTHLELEITESILIGDTKFIGLQLEKLKARGIKLALDDFGTGYSSLAYLKKFPIDMLKIDKSFVDDISIENDNNRIVQAIINLGKNLDQKVIAEGVEREEQFDMLRRNHCDIIQGYFYSKPLSAEDMTEFLKTGFNAIHEKINQKPERKASFD